MSKIISCIASLLLVLSSCTKPILEEAKEKEPIEIEDWRDGSSEDIILYPD